MNTTHVRRRLVAGLARHLHETVRRPYRELLPGEIHGEGTNLQFAKAPPATDAMVSKFPSRTKSMSSWRRHRRTLLDGDSRLAGDPGRLAPDPTRIVETG